ncbi:response regulator transcription factor [Gordonia sp. LSe1-13]|uniref:Response regulator transcription factor n=1 Tax=Gordonia sesuvii TaxID=3116777 RepID=A0ABU7MCA2_9ACTN|nr:response regulator transcription factor [Gordonia sp. LSe1-13]
MQRRTTTYVYSNDPVLQAGVASQLNLRPEVVVVSDAALDTAEVAVVVADQLDDLVKKNLKALQRNGVPRTMLVLGTIDESTVVAAAEAGVSGLVRRTDATADVLIRQIRHVADGGGVVPTDLVGSLLGQVGRLQRQVLSPRGLHFSGLTEREIDVLRLVSEGYDTAAIAKTLCYSERTVKNVLHDVTTRLQLRNRSHAVAYALREGLI